MDQHRKIVLGTAQLGLSYGINNKVGQPSTEQAFSILSKARRLGISTLDTAQAYGTSLEVIGALHQQTDFRFKILSKFKQSSLKNGSLTEELHNQLKTLNISKLHGFSFHSFQEYSEAGQELRLELNNLKSSGLIESIGVSSYTTEETLVAIQDPLIDIVQFPFNLLDNYTQRKAIFEMNISTKKRLHVRSVFLQGLLFINPEELATLKPKIKTLAPAIREIQQIAKNEGLSISSLALRYATSFSEIESLVLGVDTPAQLDELFTDLSDKLSLDIIDKVNRIIITDKNLLLPTNWQ